MSPILLLLLGCAPKVTDLAAPAPTFTLPDPGESPDFTPPAPMVLTLESGASLWVIEDHQLPLVSVRVVFDGGARLESDGEWGETVLLADLMDEAAGDYDSAGLSRALRLLAADLSADGTRDSLEIDLDVQADWLPDALSLVADVALRPRLDPGDWARIKDQHLNDLTRRSEDAGQIASYLASLRYYGADHPLGRAVAGTPASVGGLDLDDLRRVWRANVQPDRATFVVVGDVNTQDVAAMLDARFADWPEPLEAAAPEAPASWSERPGAGQVLLVDMPGATQTAIRVVGGGYAPDDPEVAGAKLANLALGGSFTSRINHLLRTELGYTYGAYSGFAQRRGASTWGLSTSVRADATADALARILEQIEGAAQGYSPGELEKARAQITSDAVGAAETRAALAGSLEARARLALPPGGAAAELEAVRAGDVGAMIAATERYWDPAKMLVLLVGDEAAIGDSLKAAGFDYQRIEEPE